MSDVFVSQPKPIDVQVITHHMQRYAVWFGGSMLASTVSKHASDTKAGSWALVALTLLSAPPARVLPGVSHQEGLRGGGTQHLPPQPRLWRHVLDVGGGAEEEAVPELAL